MKTLTNYLNESLILEYKNEFFSRKLDRRKKKPLTLKEIVDTIKDSEVEQEWLDAVNFKMEINDKQNTIFIEHPTLSDEKTNNSTFVDLEKVVKEHPDYTLTTYLDYTDTNKVYSVVNVKFNKYTKHIDFSLGAFW